MMAASLHAVDAIPQCRWGYLFWIRTTSITWVHVYMVRWWQGRTGLNNLSRLNFRWSSDPTWWDGRPPSEDLASIPLQPDVPTDHHPLRPSLPIHRSSGYLLRRRRGDQRHHNQLLRWAQTILWIAGTLYSVRGKRGNNVIGGNKGNNVIASWNVETM